MTTNLSVECHSWRGQQLLQANVNSGHCGPEVMSAQWIVGYIVQDEFDIVCEGQLDPARRTVAVGRLVKIRAVGIVVVKFEIEDVTSLISAVFFKDTPIDEN